MEKFITTQLVLLFDKTIIAALNFIFLSHKDKLLEGWIMEEGCVQLTEKTYFKWTINKNR